MMKHLSQRVALFPKETNIIFRYNKVAMSLGLMGEIPEIGDKRWLQMSTLYGNDILMVEFKETI